MKAMKTWKRFKKLFKSCIRPTNEESTISISPKQTECKVDLKETRALRVIEAEYMLYDTILRRTFVAAAKNEERACTVLDAVPAPDKDLSALQRSSVSVSGPSIDSALTITTFGYDQMITAWNVQYGFKMFIIDAFPAPIISIPQSLEFRFFQYVDEQIKVRLVDLFGSQFEGNTSLLFLSSTASRFAQPQPHLLEYTNPEGEDNSRICSGTVYDADIHSTTMDESANGAESANESANESAGQIVTLSRQHCMSSYIQVELDQSILYIIASLPAPVYPVQNYIQFSFLSCVDEEIKARLFDLFGSIHGTRFAQPLLLECDNNRTDTGAANYTIAIGTDSDAETHSMVAPICDVAEVRTELDALRAEKSMAESANGQLVPVESLRAGQMVTVSLEKCVSGSTFEIERMRNELDKGCTFYINADQDSCLVLKDISMPSHNTKGAESASICHIATARSELEALRFEFIEQILQKDEDLAKLKAKMKRGAETEAVILASRFVAKQLRSVNSVYFMDKASTSSAPQKYSYAQKYGSARTLDKEVAKSDIIFTDETETPSELFTNFEVRCPPGGQECVVLYTTTLHIVRKTFEDCNRIRSLLSNLGVNFFERDISTDLGYKKELVDVLGFRAIPPRLFIKGRCIGGAEEAIRLHESGKLKLMTWQFVVSSKYSQVDDIDTSVIHVSCEVDSSFQQEIIRARNLEESESEINERLSDTDESLIEEVNVNQHANAITLDKEGVESEIDLSDLFMNFEERCPPGGQDRVILYTTSFHSIRKTFEDCNRIRFILSNLGIKFHERDISMDLGYRDELWNVLGSRAIPPGLFIKGRYIGGAEEAIGLHESGKLKPLIWQFVIGPEERGLLCEWCGGMRFMMCAACDGSHKLYDREEDGTVPCLGCNENGLVPCALCS